MNAAVESVLPGAASNKLPWQIPVAAGASPSVLSTKAPLAWNVATIGAGCPSFGGQREAGAHRPKECESKRHAFVEYLAPIEGIPVRHGQPVMETPGKHCA